MKKFGILFLQNFQYFPEQHLPFDLDTDVRVVKGYLKQELTKSELAHWEKWKGSLIWDEIKKSRVYIEVTINSDNPLVNDKENQELHNILADAYFSLMLTAALRPEESKAYAVTGGGEVQNAKISPTRFADFRPYDDWFESGFTRSKEYHDSYSETLKKNETLEKWKTFFHEMRALRTRKGSLITSLALHSYKKGFEESYLDYRIPSFVRAIDTVIAAQRNATKLQFKNVGQTLLDGKSILGIKPRDKMIDLLDDLFEIRNSCAHGMPYGWKVRKKLKSERKMHLYEFLAEEYARAALKFALTDSNFRKASRHRGKLEKWMSQYSAKP